MSARPRLDPDRFAEALVELGSQGAIAGGAVRRPALGEAELRARRWFQRAAEAAGAEVTTDPVGTLIALRPGRRRDLPVLALTGHLDSGGSRHAGALGLVAGLEILRALAAAGTVPEAGLAVIAFNDDGGARFGLPHLGALVWSGLVGETQALALTDSKGVSLADALGAAAIETRPLRPPLEGVVQLEPAEEGAEGPLRLPVAQPAHARLELTLERAGTPADLPLALLRLLASESPDIEPGLLTLESGLPGQPVERVALPLRLTAADEGTLDRGIAALAERLSAEAGAEGARADLRVRQRLAAARFDPVMIVEARAEADRLGLEIVSPPLAAPSAAGILAARLPALLIEAAPADPAEPWAVPEVAGRALPLILALVLGQDARHRSGADRWQA